MDLKRFFHYEQPRSQRGTSRVASVLLAGVILLFALAHASPAHAGSLLASLLARANAADVGAQRAVAPGILLASIGGAALLNSTPPVTVEGPRRASPRWVVPVGSQFRVLATGYSSTPDQTDSSPFITASGTRVHDGTVATNFLPFGAKIRFLDYRPGMTFIVEDRHHPRLSDRIDLWFASRAAAIQFGARVLQIEVVE